MAFYTHQLCSLCEGSPLFFRQSKDGALLYLYCSECNSVWPDPRDTAPASALHPSARRWIIPSINVSLTQHDSKWATAPLIEAAGFADMVAGESEETEF